MSVQTELKLLFFAAGIFVCYLNHGIIIDGIYQQRYGPQKEKFHYSMVLTFVTAVVNVFFAWFTGHLFSWLRGKSKIEVIKESDKKKKGDDFQVPSAAKPEQVPFWQLPIIAYSLPSVCQVAAGYFGNLSLEHIDVPTKELAKTLKPVPVLLMGVLFLKNRHHPSQYISVLMVCGGVALFMTQNVHSKEEEVTSLFGFFLTFLSLVCDGLVGTLQDKLKKSYQPSSSQLMFYTNFWGTVLSFIGIFVTGEAFTALAFCKKYPEIVLELFWLSAASALGQTFIFLTISEFGPLKNSLITTTRKFFQVLLNTFWYGRTLTIMKWVAVSIVFLGVLLDRYGDYQSKGSKHGDDKHKAHQQENKSSTENGKGGRGSTSRKKAD